MAEEQKRDNSRQPRLSDDEEICKSSKLALFEGKQIRKTWHNNEWWFVLEDIVFALTDSKDPKQYIQKMKQRDEPLSQGWVQIVLTLEIETFGGKQKMNCVSTQGAFRIIQSIPSLRAEPFKLWLAKVGYERIQEIENPELAQDRMKQLYEQKGYSKEWIEKRLRGIAIRQELTDEWKQRGVEQNLEFAILTNEISKATFGKTVDEYRKHKNLSKENLRDHMNDLELIFTMLGEKVTTEITKSKDAENFVECKTAANDGGTVAGNARKDAENRIGHSVVSNENYLTEPENKKRLENKKK
ncbi:MAG: BRO family protein [Nanoarchaeota archaeon]|nr:phage antirepressor protein [Nanoarchaeota archaeon]MBU4300043.1 phage antirepressor protein [Nanoarchaeota archaeon]MBU4451844.1 phage antirepressor protein [Nanoarchaeota archaeon]MCG2724420.1 phage antirepressor protein [archaeon]